MSGSYNWTDSAERFNQENAIVLDDPAVVQRYQAHGSEATVTDPS